MISDLSVLIGIMLLGYVLTDILKTKEGFGPVLGIAVSMAVLEAGGAFGVLWPVAFLLRITSFVLPVIYLIGMKNKTGVRAYFLNPAVIGFLFAAVFYMALSSGRTLLYRDWDTFMHWGMFSKAVFYRHSLDVWNSDLSVNHAVYPHGMASWYSLFALGKRVYAERDVMLSINTLLFAASSPVIDMAVCRIKKLLPFPKVNLLIVYPVSAMSVAGFLWIWKFSEIQSYTSGYMDIPLGAAFMVSLCAIAEKNACSYRKAVSVSLLSAMLVMIKPSGILFVGVVWLVYLGNEYFDRGFCGKVGGIGKLFCGGLLLLSVPLAELCIWNVMMKFLNVAGGDQFSLSGFRPDHMIARYRADTSYAELVPAVVRNFFTAFFARCDIVFMSAAGWMALCMIIAVLTMAVQKDGRLKKKQLYITVCMVFCFFLYNLFLLWTYLTTMSEEEALGVKCYDRYIGSYIIGWFVLEIYILFYKSIGTVKIRRLYLSFFFLGCVIGFLNKHTFLSDIPSDVQEAYGISEKIQGCVPEISRDLSGEMPDLWLSYASEEAIPENDQIIQLKYYLFPDFDYIDINRVQSDYGRGIGDIIEEFSLDYVVLYGVNENFYNAYYWFFSDGLSNATARYEDQCYQAYKVIRDETTNEFRWLEPVLYE